MKVLITGANGFLGSAIVRQANASRMPFCATDLHGSPAVQGIDYDRSDITDPSGMKPLPEGLSCIIHTAGLAHIFDGAQAEGAPFHTVNVAGTVNMIEAAAIAGVEHFVLISSVSVYGPYTHGVYDENVPCSPVGPYAISKYEAELGAREIAERTGMVLTIMRLSTLYGEGDPGNVGRLVRSLDRRRFVWIGTGANRKSLLHKDDAARACLAAATRPASGINVFNVSAPPCMMREIVDGISDALGKRPFPVSVPASLALLLSKGLSNSLHQTIKKWLSEDVYSTDRFDGTYGFKTAVSLKDGLKREVDWYRHNKAAD